MKLNLLKCVWILITNEPKKKSQDGVVRVEGDLWAPASSTTTATEPTVAWRGARPLQQRLRLRRRRPPLTGCCGRPCGCSCRGAPGRGRTGRGKVRGDACGQIENVDWRDGRTGSILESALVSRERPGWKRTTECCCCGICK